MRLQGAVAMAAEHASAEQDIFFQELEYEDFWETHADEWDDDTFDD